MRKRIVLVLVLSMILSVMGCGSFLDDPEVEKSEGVMTYREYVLAELDSEVVIETYVQGKQKWSENTATIYTQDADGGYLLYNMSCSESEYNKLSTGTKIRVTGIKAEWSGESEIANATFEIIDGSYTAKPEDVSDLLIGMNAEVSIIVSSGSDNFNVPIDAVGKNTDGQNVVYVQNENGEFDEVVVETGLSSGYYIEIFSDELVVGAKVRASANEDDAKVKIVQDEESNDFSQMFGIGGMIPGQGSNFNPGSGGNFTPGNGFNGNRQNGNSGFNRGGN